MLFSNRIIQTAALLVVLAAAAAAQEPPASHPIRDRLPLDDLPLRVLSPLFDNFAIELKNSPDDRLFLIVYGGRRGCRGYAARRGRVWKDYFVNRRGIAPERVLIIDGGYRENFSADYFFVPPGAPEPGPSPTVDPAEVHFFRSNSPRCRARRR
ncbi:MAG: hypothetical protein LC795_16530 [Acidobacteria bacterium]|nr:hypothetical protein [Acidobacteriota bacterium]